MDCKKTQRKLEAYLSGELSEEENRSIRDHLSDCDECGVELERLRTIQDTLRQKRTPPVPEGFARRVVSRARETGETGRSERIVSFESWTKERTMWRVAVAAVFLVGVGIGLVLTSTLSIFPEDGGVRTAEAPRDEVVEQYHLDYLAGPVRASMHETYAQLTSPPEQREE